MAFFSYMLDCQQSYIAVAQASAVVVVFHRFIVVFFILTFFFRFRRYRYWSKKKIQNDTPRTVRYAMKLFFGIFLI